MVIYIHGCKSIKEADSCVMENLSSKLLLKTLPSCAWLRLPVLGRQTSPGVAHAQHRVYSFSHGQVLHSVVSIHLAIGKLNFQQLFVAMVLILWHEKLSSRNQSSIPLLSVQVPSMVRWVITQSSLCNLHAGSVMEMPGAPHYPLVA